MTAATFDPASQAGISSITGRQWFLLLTVQLCTLLFGMTITLTNVVLPQVQGALSATQDQMAWVVTFNLVATAVGTPLSSWLANRLGWRNLMFSAVFGFTIFSFLCGIANSLEVLILYRVGQGFFGAAIMPIGQAVLLASFPRHLQPLVMMMWGIGGVVGPVFGPIFGSLISEAYNWRAAFFMIVPFGLAASAAAWFSLAQFTQRQPTRFDWTGFLALAATIGAAQLMLDRGQRLDWFESTEIVAEALVVGVGLWVFVTHSLTAERPFLDPRLLLDRNFAVGLVLALVMGMLSYVTLVLFPSLLHDLRGYPDSAIGLLLASRGLGNWISFLVVVPFTRWNPRLSVTCGLIGQAASGWAMAQLDINLTSFDVFWTNVLQGFGVGLAYTPMMVLTFTTLAPRYMTEGTAVFNLMRNFGSSVFISIAIVLLVRTSAANHAGMTEFMSPYNRALAYPDVLGQWSLASPAGLKSIAGEIQRQSAMIGYLNAFYLFSFTAMAAVPLVWLMRDPGR